MAVRTPVDEWVGAGDCPRCGAAYAPLQQYCLECGMRLPDDETDEAATFRARVVPPGPALWPLLATLVVAVVALAAIIAVRLTEDEPAETLVATPAGPRIVTATQPEPADELPLPTLPTPATAPAATTPVPTPPASPPPGALTEWPGGDGWTIVLLSATSRSTATARARAASQAGVEDVGVLDSSEYASLHPGYFVVFAGVYESRAQAQAALDEVQERGFAAAYVREIASSR